MKVPPRDSENTAWPMAAIMTRGVRSDAWNLRMYHSTPRSEEHTSELQSLRHLVCRLLLEKKKKKAPRDRRRPRPPQAEQRSRALGHRPGQDETRADTARRCRQSHNTDETQITTITQQHT